MVFRLNTRHFLKEDCRITAFLLIVGLLSSCNLLGITPQRRQDPNATRQVAEAPNATKKSSETSDKINLRQNQDGNSPQGEPSKLLERIESIENQIDQDRRVNQERLKLMDRTISLLEKRILQMQLKVERHSANNVSSRKQNPEIKSGAEKRQQSLPEKSVQKEPKGNKTLKTRINTGDIKTPQSSKAIETVSLFKSNKNQPNKIKNKPAKPASKPPIIGMEPKQRKRKDFDKRQSWEDPDLEDPPSPIQLRIVSGAKRRYQLAFKVYSSRNYDESIKQFNAFLINFPNDQDADNSQFWIGQSHFQLGNYLYAERAFRKVLRNYPHGTTRRGFKTPDAILMLGRIYMIRKKPIKARYYFEQVVKHYPGSRSAVKATRELEAMDSF